ncbi:replication protein A 70 kDa DNA-binding subunit B isoform X2 [Zea mays]|uniref:Replication protein n=1 Tax=Zea mays TaxID=4577 RepID=A0A804PC92_MAIZE|nr:replication protein A 70 kDa DNA-binding subunit B isoform X2 [Zea mays]|eukprot:XP_020393935.1 replication protein A 70 kDa DNA-binding subunit B isoform X2 [Zea mays]
MGDILIPSLMVGDCSHSLCVRASRLWEFLDPQDDSRLLHTDLVLLDEEGNSIHAQIYPPLCQQFSALLDEGAVYNLKYFLVRKANRFYKPVENCNMISFTKWTTVEVVLQIPPAFPVCTYNLTPIEQLQARVDYKEYFTDVVGVVSVISHVSSLRTRGRQAEVMKRTVTISNARDTGPTVDVVLWGERATTFPAEQIHRDSRSSPQIIVFVGTLVRSYADNVSLSGGSSCKWYINAPLPEVNALRASAETNHNPVIWDQGKAAAESTVIAVPEYKKLKDIKYLHPFENKKKEWLVVIKILKIDRSWWYNACKKCLRTTKPHGDTYKCTNNSCDSIGSPTPRYKISLTAEDDTDTAEFIFFGRMAQRLIKKNVDTLISTNPPGFIPREITDLLEKSFEWNVSFTESTIIYGSVSFQVNAINAEMDGGNMLPTTPSSQPSSTILSQGHGSGVAQNRGAAFIREPSLTPESHKVSSSAKCNIQTTPHQGDNLLQGTEIITSPPNVQAPSGAAYSVLDGSTNKAHKSVVGKRSRTSPSKKVAKKLFRDEDTGDDDVAGSADVDAE